MSSLARVLALRLSLSSLLGSLAIAPLPSQCDFNWVGGPPSAGPSALVRCALHLPNGDLVLAGHFEAVEGTVAGGIARWDGSQWHSLGSGLSHAATSMLRLPNGDLVVGGHFIAAGGNPAGGIARWDGSTWSTFAGGCNGAVNSIVRMPNGDLVAGGTFTSAGGVPCNRIARWDGTSWWPLGPGIDQATVNALCVLPSGDLVVGGSFGSIGGAAIANIARWDGIAWSSMGVLPWFPSQLAVSASGVPVVGGSNVQAWNGAAWTPLGSSPLQVRGMSFLANGDLIVGGRSLGASSVLERWNGSGWTSLPNPPSAQQNWAFVEHAGVLTVCGMREDDVTVSRGFVSQWNGTSWNSLAGPTPPRVKVFVTLPSGELLAGGRFDNMYGVSMANVAVFTNNTWTALGTGVDGEVTCATFAPNGDIIVGGEFQSAGTTPCPRIARWNGVTWSPMGAGLPVAPRALAVTPDGRVIAGGAPAISGVGVPVVAWDGTSWSALGTNLTTVPGSTSSTPTVTALTVMPNGDVVAAGSGLRLDNIFLNGIVRHDGTTWSQMAWVAGVTSFAWLPGGRLMAGTKMTTMDWLTWTNLIEWSGSEWLPFAGGHFGELGGNVDSMSVLPNGDLLVGGLAAFVSPAGLQYGDCVGRWNGTSWTHVGALFTGNVTAVGSDENGFVFVSGGFAVIGGMAGSRLTMSVPTCPAGVAPLGSGCVGSAGPLTLTAQNVPFAGGTYRATATGFPSSSLGVAVFGVNPIALPLIGPGCALHVDPIVMEVIVPSAGAATSTLTLPRDNGLAGQAYGHQVVVAEFGPSGIADLTSTNSLLLFVGGM